jgi:hypothetical protein
MMLVKIVILQFGTYSTKDMDAIATCASDSLEMHAIQTLDLSHVCS